MRFSVIKFFSKSKEFPSGEYRFHITYFENPSDVDMILSILKTKFNVLVVQDRNGVWFRRVDLRKDKNTFAIYWDEDLDIFFISTIQTPESNQWLEEFLNNDIIPAIENEINNLQSQSYSEK
jgi:hypothetical protein